MATEEVLRKTLRNADGKPFLKYKGIQNTFSMDDFELSIDDVQPDRSGHTRMHVRVPMKLAGFPEDTRCTRSREIALRDLIARRFWESARTNARSPIPKTDGGEVYIPRPGQEIIERMSVVVTDHYVEVRFTADLPAAGGKVSASATEELIFGRIRTIVTDSMMFSSYKRSKLYNHLETAENADHIRASLDGMGLSAFVSDGAVLPRREDNLAPLVDAVPFSCDDALRVTMEVPNGDPVTGMGVRKGFTAVVGPSRSGKSTLADALLAGAYNHIPGDGREYVVSDPNVAFVVSEPGRPADGVDVSASVRDPEFGQYTGRCSSPMSEYVALSEAVEAGSGLVVMDEEYSNPCIIRRGFMTGDNGIVPISDIAHPMGERGISVLMITGDESAVRKADHVLMVDGYVASSLAVERIESDSGYDLPQDRYPMSNGISYEKGRKEVSVTAPSVRAVEIGEYRSEAPVAGVFDTAQTRLIADALVVARELMDGSRTLRQVCEESIAQVMAEDRESKDGQGMHHAYARPIDMAAFLNRHPQMLAIQKRG